MAERNRLPQPPHISNDSQRNNCHEWSVCSTMPDECCQLPRLQTHEMLVSCHVFFFFGRPLCDSPLLSAFRFCAVCFCGVLPVTCGWVGGWVHVYVCACVYVGRESQFKMGLPSLIPRLPAQLFATCSTKKQGEPDIFLTWAWLNCQMAKD